MNQKSANRNLIAILRGIKPDEVLEVAQVIVEAGISCIEVPLNSPDPLNSIGRLVDQLGTRVQIGAGTVLRCEDVEAVASVGGQLIVSPHCDPNVIEATRTLGMSSIPGVLTASECFTALHHGANALKFFPSFQLGPDGLSALKAVLPTETLTYAVGGVGPTNFRQWIVAGVTGFGIGSAIYKPGSTMADVSERARAIVAAYDDCVQAREHIGVTVESATK